MLAVMSGVCMAKSWTCGRSGSCRSPGRATWSQIGTVSGGRIWGLLMGRCWGLMAVGRRRWERRGGGCSLRGYRCEHEAGSRNTTGQSTLRCPAQREMTVIRVFVALDFVLCNPPLPPPHHPGEARTGGCHEGDRGGLGHDRDKARRRVERGRLSCREAGGVHRREVA